MSRPVILHDPQGIRRKIQEEQNFCFLGGVYFVPDLFKVDAISCLYEEGLDNGAVQLDEIVKKATYQQLIWEVCSSSYLRPVEKITGYSALIPDPFVTDGGIFLLSEILAFKEGRHPDTRLVKAVSQYLFLEDCHVIVGEKRIEVNRGSVFFTTLDYKGKAAITFDKATLFFCCHYYQNK